MGMSTHSERPEWERRKSVTVLAADGECVLDSFENETPTIVDATKLTMFFFLALDDIVTCTGYGIIL